MIGQAVLLMCFSILIIWGGLVASVVMLKRKPAPYDEEFVTDMAEAASRE